MDEEKTYTKIRETIGELKRLCLEFAALNDNEYSMHVKNHLLRDVMALEEKYQ